MRAPALRVPRAEAEALRSRLARRGFLDPTLAIERDGDGVLLPVRPGYVPDPGDPPLTEHDFADRAATGPRRYQDLVELPEPLRAQLPRAFDVAGDIVLIRLPPELRPYGPAIGQALLAFVPGTRLVGEDLGVHGIERVRRIERLAGTGTWRTLYRENGLTLEIDLEAAYFSPRLAREHARVAARAGPGERVLDLCCGVGPFAVAIARAAPTSEVVGVDVNPRAIALARANAERSRVADRVRFVEADVGAFLPGAGRYDRIVLNLPHEGARFLPDLGGHLAPGGVLHYYEIVDRTAMAERARAIRALLGADAPGAEFDEHLVHEYSPGSDLRGYTIKRSPVAAP